MAPVITAIIPTFRRAALLKRAVLSVLAQSRSELRVLVCDNASDDDTREVVTELARNDARVLYHRHDKNMGAQFNFQYGLDAVTTEMFSFLSDDDLLFPDFYRRAVDRLETEPDAGFYASQTVLYDVSRGTHSLRPAKHWREGRHEAGVSARLMLLHPFVWTGCVFRTAVRETVGALVPVPMGDVLFTVKAASAFPFVAELRVGALFSETDSNFSRGLPIDTLRRSGEVARAWAAGIPGVSGADREEMVRIVDTLMVDMARRILREALEAGDHERFLEAADCLLERPGMSGSRKAKLAIGRRGGWSFRALSLWTRLRSGTKRRRASGWQRLSIDDVLAKYR
jgi:glycosyltransferase involved in cell wall biosynthesis